MFADTDRAAPLGTTTQKTSSVHLPDMASGGTALFIRSQRADTSCLQTAFSWIFSSCGRF